MLPRLILIADRFTLPARAARVMEAVAAGVQWVHLRDHEAPFSEVRDTVRTVVPRIRADAPDVILTINTHLAVAHEFHAAVHLGTHGPTIKEATEMLGAHTLIGWSAHDVEEARLAVADGASYVFFSPIFPTASKPDHPGIGLRVLQACCQALPATSVFALGGIEPSHVQACLKAGAHGVVVLSGIMNAADPRVKVQAYLNALS